MAVSAPAVLDPPRELQRWLPPSDLLPVFCCEDLILDYPLALNAAYELLDRAVVEGLGYKRCLVDLAGEWSYRELSAQASRLAFAFHRRGVRRGTRILLRGFNSRPLVAAWFAVLKLGAVAVTTFPSLRHRELEQICKKARVSHAFCETSLEAELVLAQESLPVLADILFYDGNDTAWNAVISGEDADFPVVDTAAEDAAIIAFTSGSTGEPKGCVHLHRDLLAIADTFSAHVLRPREDDLFCGTPSLAFTFGLGGLVVFPMRARAAALLVRTPGIDALAEAIERFRPTICFTAPTGYRCLADPTRSCDLSSLRMAVSAGEPLPHSTRDAFKERTGIDLIDGLGSTEMLHIFISADPESIRRNAIGRVVPGFQARVVDEAGDLVAAGQIGRLAIRGPTGCRYIDDDRQSRYVQRGWNVTGDSVYQDEDGYFYYVARNDDLIVSAGYKIAAPEVEAALLRHPIVVDCAVAGIPDAKRGQVVGAWVVARSGVLDETDTKDQLLAHLRGELASYKHPRKIIFVDNLPRTETGKLQRFKLQ